MNIILFIFLIVISGILWNAISSRLAKSFCFIVLLTWFIPLVISMSNPFGLKEVSIDTYSIVIVGILSFEFGYLALNKPIRRINPINVVNEIRWISTVMLIRILFLLCLGLLFFLAVTQWTLIAMQGGMGNLKLDFFELIFNNNSFLFFIYQALLVPLFYISCMIFAYMALSGAISLKVILLLLYAFIFSYVGGKRGYFSIFIQYFIIAYIAKRFAKSVIRSNIKKKNLIKIIGLGILAFIGAAYMTTIGNSGSGFEEADFTDAARENIENVIVYQIGPYRALDYALNHDYIDKYGGYTFGRSTLGGTIDYYGCGLLNLLGIPIRRARDLSMNPLQNNSIDIGENRTWNFSYTSFYYFMFDLGWIGIIIFPFLFGMFVRYSVNLYNKTATVGSLCLLGYMFIACGLFNASWFNIALYAQPIIIISQLLSNFELSKRSKLKNCKL